MNGTCAGGGYELALAATTSCWPTTASPPCRCPSCRCSRVLPGTGGLTRVTDKRKVRRDLADVFCTTEEGVRGQTRGRMAAGRRGGAELASSKTAVQERAQELAAQSRPAGRRARASR